MSDQEVLLDVRDLVMHFPIHRGVFQTVVGYVHAVDGISFEIRRGETLGLVGESGCGKSTTGRAILQLYKPTAGRVIFQGQNLVNLRGEKLRRMRRQMQMIFQDPYASLNPRMSVEQIVGEPLQIHNILKGSDVRDRVKELLELVRLNPSYIDRYPHEFSGGQRQRIGVARALALQPELIICDEPISALDVSVQAQVVNLLEDLQKDMKLTYLFIAHDLSMVRHISDRVAVMYLGIMAELAERDELYSNPLHPYTIALLSAVPIPSPVIEAKRKRIILKGDVPSPVNPPSGCRFHTRCPLAEAICSEKRPVWREVRPDHFVACHLVQAESFDKTRSSMASREV
ncbi:MAG: dipeptide ABC transporter ATP-binding protein [Anaerolineaceae bacterium]|nr:dipeptide ABC transporter ATP-binding protein [Anaerolineaceae bacterium]MBN2677624.1 dipeptide ABC transporter ATP-binding protein [Anaerolineaceae bacterium]